MAAATKGERIRELELAVAGLAAVNQHMQERIRVLELQTAVKEVHVVEFEFAGKTNVYARYDLAREAIERHIVFLAGRESAYYKHKAKHCQKSIYRLTPECDYWDTADEWDDDRAPSIIYTRTPLFVEAGEGLAY